MSNQINLVRTMFTNTRTGHEAFGWRAYDDYNKTYENAFGSPEHEDDKEFFLSARACDNETFDDMIDSFLLSDESVNITLSIDGADYERETIRRWIAEDSESQA